MQECQVCHNAFHGERCPYCGTPAAGAGWSTAAPPAPYERRSGGGSVGWIFAGILALVLVAAAIAYGVAVLGQDDEQVAGDEATVTVVTETASPPPTAEVPTAAAPPSSASTATVTETTRTVTATEDGTEVVTELPSGSWLVVLESLEKSDHSAAYASQRAGQLSGGYGTVVVDSSTIPGLRPGYWAVSVVGFGSQEAARAACRDMGYDLGGDCYERQVG